MESFEEAHRSAFKTEHFRVGIPCGFTVDSIHQVPHGSTMFHIDSGMGFEAHELLDFGAKRRAVGATQMNATSSRRLESNGFQFWKAASGPQ